MELLPAIDLVGGEAVRLVQGDFGRRSDHGDPLALARRYVASGARWLHVVDLDAARDGGARNRLLVLELVGIARAGGVSVEVGGGVRTAGDVDDLVAAGCDRVVLGTAAVEDPRFALDSAQRHPGRVAVGIDYRRRPDGSLEPAVRGWAAGAPGSVADLVAAMDAAPLAALVVTAIDRDGTMGGPDVDGLSAVLDATALPVVASGGVRGAGDLRRLAALRSPVAGRGPVGAVVGRALVDGTTTIEEALAACVPSG